MDGVAMYSALAERERIPERKTIFQRLAELEKKHPDQWASRLKSLGPRYRRQIAGRAMGRGLRIHPAVIAAAGISLIAHFAVGGREESDYGPF